MSAIWGIIHLNKQEADYNLGLKMENAMNPYKLDRCITEKNDNVILGCGHQYITKESIQEKLPYFDKINMLYYSADCILDNREELLTKLNIQDKGIPDGELLYCSYKKWASDFTEYVLGTFAISIYDEKKNCCYLYADHTGSRSLYYYISDNTVYFSTIFSPLIAVLPEDNVKINDKWMVGCELSNSPSMMVYREITPFENIYLVEAAHSVTIELKDNKLITSKTKYWDPTHCKVIKLKSQDEYKDLFLKTLQQCVRDVLRSFNNIGMTLSSGLDSASVACIAAKCLEEEHKNLYSFTSIPLSDYEGDKNPYYLSNESEGVNIICKAYPNIVPEFIRCEGKNAFSELKRLIRLSELPHKSRQNMVWLDEICERASQKGCNVILKGQYGNTTVSYGAILSRVHNDFCHMKWRSAYHEMGLFCQMNHISRKKAIKIFLKELKCKVIFPYNKFENTMIKSSELKKFNIIKTINHSLKSFGTTNMDSRRQKANAMYNMVAFTQIGAFDTRFGLMHGIMFRDPLKDKRIIELCCRLPMKCFVQSGVERALIRNNMREIVPNEILDNVSHRGLQGADFKFRIENDWNNIGKDMINTVMNPKLLKYIDNKKLERLIGDMKTDKILDSEDDLVNALMLCSCSLFLDEFEK